MAQILFVAAGPNGTVPKRADENAAGYDLYSSEDRTILSGTRALVDTDICIRPPRGCYARIAPRSSMAVNGVDVGAGVVDRNYTGTLKVLLINHASVNLIVDKGQRIAQLILERHETPPIQLVDRLPETGRGSQGFGSTGR